MLLTINYMVSIKNKLTFFLIVKNYDMVVEAEN